MCSVILCKQEIFTSHLIEKLGNKCLKQRQQNTYLILENYGLFREKNQN